MSSEEIHQKFKNDGYYVANNVVENDDIEKILESVSRAYFKHNVNSKFLSFARLGHIFLSNNINKFINPIKIPFTFRMYPTLHDY